MVHGSASLCPLPCLPAPQGTWVAHWGPFVARYSGDGATPLSAEEAEAIPHSQAWLASCYWASTTILTGRRGAGAGDQGATSARRWRQRQRVAAS